MIDKVIIIPAKIFVYPEIFHAVINLKLKLAKLKSMTENFSQGQNLYKFWDILQNIPGGIFSWRIRLSCNVGGFSEQIEAWSDSAFY